MDALELLTTLSKNPTVRKNREHIETMAFLADRTGLANYPIPLVLITGTCGKGSTQLFLSSILEANGYKVGLLQSPHLISFSERIQINRVPLSEEEILSSIDNLMPHFEDALRVHTPSYNQIFFTAGLQLFKEHAVDFVLMESGIGGYSDPCSYFNPMVSIITNVHKDHEFFLGNTYESIAYDKSGIIKRKRPVVTGAKVYSALEVIRTEAEKKQAPFYALQEHFQLETLPNGGIYSEEGFRLPYELQAFGDFQGENAALAIKASLLISHEGYAMDSRLIQKGVRDMLPPARFQIVSDSPYVVVDGAHNEEEIRNFCEAVRKLHCKHHYLILGFSSNKDITSMIRKLESLEGTLLFTPHSNVQRTAALDELITFSHIIKDRCLTFESLEQAYEYAKNNSNEEDGIFFTGSMFLAGDALKLIQNRDRTSKK
jgi:dihydrofolate synthase/folylpolyglutamate synthase